MKLEESFLFLFFGFLFLVERWSGMKGSGNKLPIMVHPWIGHGLDPCGQKSTKSSSPYLLNTIVLIDSMS